MPARKLNCCDPYWNARDTPATVPWHPWDRLADRPRRGRFFSIEHPGSSAAWREAAWLRMTRLPGVRVVAFDQCRFGARDRGGARIRKRTKVAANFDISRLGRRCTHGTGAHVPLQGGARTAASAAYPPRLCRALAQAARKAMQR